MSRRRMLVDSRISTLAQRASNCSERLRRKQGQCSIEDDILELGDHLAAVADAEGEAVGTLEELLELFLELLVVENGFCPTGTGAEYVAVGEAAAGDKSGKAVELCATVEEIRHVQVNGFESGTVKGEGHFVLPVDALFAKDRHARTGARSQC